MSFHVPAGPSCAKCGQGSRTDQVVNGFSLAELLIATLILTFGLLAAAQFIYSAVCSASLARSKGSIAVVAQDKLEFLADLYARNPGAAELTNGNHGPDLVPVVNPLTGAVLNRFSVTWQVSMVADPRPGKSLVARQVVVIVKPINAANGANYRAYLNKAAIVAGIFSPRN
jgi:Tfp pilus assembly protein PilV